MLMALNVIMLSVIMQNAIILSVVAPFMDSTSMIETATR